MNFLEKLFDKDPFLLDRKDNYFKKIFQLTKFHYNNSYIYKTLIDKLKLNFKDNYELEKFPYYLSLFKDLDLIWSKNKIIKTYCVPQGLGDQKFTLIKLTLLI